MSDNLYASYFSTVSTERKSPPKNKTAFQEPPKKLSKSFTRQLAETLGTTSSRKKKGKGKGSGKGKRKSYTTAKKMSKRSAPADSESGSSSKKPKAAVPEKETDKEGQPFWEISGKRRLQLSEFKGTTMVGIREFYEKNGEALPGKKGISMTVEQFNTIVELLPQIESELRGKGLELARPKYGGAGDGADGKTGDEEESEGVGDGEEEEEGAGNETHRDEEA